MAKLTERQKKNIIAAYAAGGVSLSDLAGRYKVSVETIRRAVKSDGDFVKKCEDIKKESDEETFKSLKDYFSSNQKFAKNLIGRLLDIPDELIAASTLRERVGAASYIKEMFTADGAADEREPISVVINLADTSGEVPTEGGGDDSM